MQQDAGRAKTFMHVHEALAKRELELQLVQPRVRIVRKKNDLLLPGERREPVGEGGELLDHARLLDDVDLVPERVHLIAGRHRGRGAEPPFHSTGLDGRQVERIAGAARERANGPLHRGPIGGEGNDEADAHRADGGHGEGGPRSGSVHELRGHPLGEDAAEASRPSHVEQQHDEAPVRQRRRRRHGGGIR